jgi:hypothetical protein
MSRVFLGWSLFGFHGLFCTISLMDGQQDSPETPWQFKPGDTVMPGQGTEASPAPATDEHVAATPPDPTPNTQEFSGGESISWTASEFIAHNKSVSWYLVLGLAAVILVAGVWFMTKDVLSAVLIAFAITAFGVYAARAPRALRYELSEEGLTIGQKHYGYEEFRSFSVIPEGAFSSIAFMPLRRFAPPTTIYYDPADEERIVALLAERVPMEEHRHDAIDRFMRRIRY